MIVDEAIDLRDRGVELKMWGGSRIDDAILKSYLTLYLTTGFRMEP